MASDRFSPVWQGGGAAVEEWTEGTKTAKDRRLAVGFKKGKINLSITSGFCGRLLASMIQGSITSSKSWSRAGSILRG